MGTRRRYRKKADRFVALAQTIPTQVCPHIGYGFGTARGNEMNDRAKRYMASRMYPLNMNGK
jgi:hypothetical protein